MKKLLAAILCLLMLTVIGCTGTKKQVPPPPKSETDINHLSAEDKGITMKVSRGVRDLSKMIQSSKSGYKVVSTQVAIENNSKDNIPISPDFVALKTTDGKVYKYSPSLTETVTSKASFKKVTLPPDYRGGGLLIFEIKDDSQAESLIYKDTSGRNMVIKFNTTSKTNI